MLILLFSSSLIFLNRSLSLWSASFFTFSRNASYSFDASAVDTTGVFDSICCCVVLKEEWESEEVTHWIVAAEGSLGVDVEERIFLKNILSYGYMCSIYDYLLVALGEKNSRWFLYRTIGTERRAFINGVRSSWHSK
jgi:hypothetical protein